MIKISQVIVDHLVAAVVVKDLLLLVDGLQWV